MNNNKNSLKRRLNNRHIQMIALGGVIGTGLFYGSAKAISLVGPAIGISYLIGGLVIYCIMRMAGEMSTAEPVAGSFSYFAYKYWGDFAGFLTGWNYWFLYILVSMAELSVIGLYINFWFPEIPHWISSLLVLLLITCFNLLSVRFYGEFEFILSLIKVIAVIGMILLGIFLIIEAAMNGNSNIGISNLYRYEGFMPYGFKGLVFSLVVVMFSFGGTELICVAAGETDNPQKTIPKAINQITWRILIFYILSLMMIVMLIPWNTLDESGSPFVLIFDRLNIPYAPDVLNFVVLFAAISVYNSGIYSNGRMLYTLAQQGNAPRIFSVLSTKRVPVIAVLFSSAITLVAVFLNYLIPQKAFLHIMIIAVAAAVITWGMIVLVHLKYKRQNKKQKIIFPTPFVPYINYFCLAFLVMLLIVMTQMSEQKYAVYVLPFWIGFIFILYKIKLKRSFSK